MTTQQLAIVEAPRSHHRPRSTPSRLRPEQLDRLASKMCRRLLQFHHLTEELNSALLDAETDKKIDIDNLLAMIDDSTRLKALSGDLIRDLNTLGWTVARGEVL